MFMQPCPICGNPVRVGAKFCGKCGRPIPAPMPPAAPQVPMGIQCPNCGNVNRPGAKFCGRCQTPLAANVPGGQPPPQIADQLGAAPNWAYWARHALIAGSLLVCLLLSLSGVGVYDVNNPLPTATLLVVQTPTFSTLSPISTTPEVVIAIDTIGRLGLRTTAGKRLTYASNGDTNNTRVQVDGSDASFGDHSGSFTAAPRMTGTGMSAVWNYRGVETREEATITVGATTRRTDTMRVQYTLTNRSSQTRRVGLRVMLDTLIGDNDGVPFLFAGENTITTNAKDVRGNAVPDYIQALERASVSNPGTIVNLAVRGGDAVPPDRLVVSGWYTNEPPWEYLNIVGGIGAPLTRGGAPGRTPDSAVGLYYDAKSLAPNESRTIVFYYGLGGIAASGKLGLTVPLEVAESEKFSIIVVVMEPRTGQSVQLALPDVIALGDGEAVTKNVSPVPGAQFTQVSWKLRAKKATDAAAISVRLDPDGTTASQTIKVVPCGVTRPCNPSP